VTSVWAWAVGAFSKGRKAVTIKQ